MKVAIISPYRTVAPHFETELEIAQLHLDQGDEVQMISCLGELPCCDFNPEHKTMRCSNCVGRREHGASLLSPELKLTGIERYGPFDLQPIDVKFDSLENLQTFTIDRFDIGYAVLSSLVSILREPSPDVRENKRLIDRLMTASWMSYQATLNLIDRDRIDRLYVFNGRFCFDESCFESLSAEKY